MIAPGLRHRLRLIRLAYDRLREADPASQAGFAKFIGVSPTAWNNAESGDNSIGVEAAIKLCNATGATLDYVFRAESSALPHALAVEIVKLSRK